MTRFRLIVAFLHISLVAWSPTAFSDEPRGRGDTTPPCKLLDDSWPDLHIDLDANTVSRSNAAGKRLWKCTLDGLVDTGWVTVVRDKQRIYLASKGGVTALDNGSGKVLWFSKGPNASLLLSGDLLLATGSDDMPGPWVAARSVKDGRCVFKTRLPWKDTEPVPITAAANLFAVVRGWDGIQPWRSVLVDRRGRVRFEFDRQVVAGLQQADDYVLLTSKDLVRVSGDGKTRWRHSFATDLYEGGGLTAVAGGDVLAYRFGIGWDSGVQVLRLQPAKGTLVWSTHCDGVGLPHSAYRHRATATIEGPSVHITSCGSSGTVVEILDLKSGQQRKRTVTYRE